jgi:surface antigen
MAQGLSRRQGAVIAVAIAALVCGTLPLSRTAYAEPPSHAPAHGWRKKHDPYYMGYTGNKWSHDYGVISGHCDRQAVGAVLGGATGAVIGGAASEGDGVAILVGAVLGAVVGGAIGREMDRTDRACIGHALELAPENQRVGWTGANGVAYSVTPLKGFNNNGRQCREYVTEFKSGKHKEKVKERACRNPDGTWVTID